MRKLRLREARLLAYSHTATEGIVGIRTWVWICPSLRWWCTQGAMGGTEMPPGLTGLLVCLWTWYLKSSQPFFDCLQPHAEERTQIQRVTQSWPSQIQGFPYVIIIALSSEDGKIYTKWDQPVSKVQILLSLPDGWTPTLLAKMCVRPPWCFSQCLRFFFLDQS